MAAHSQTCTMCGRRWPQRDARFCGGCGAMLDGSVDAGRSRGLRRAITVASRAVGVIALVAAVATISTLDLSRERPDTPVEVDEDLTPGGPPLSATDRAALRRQADPNQLRCEPRGCELWRLDRRDAAFGNGIVVRDDGVLLGLRGYVFGTDTDDGGDEPEGRRLLVAIDPTTGEELWERRIATVGSPTDWAQLIDAPDGALITSSGELISVDDEGEVRWHWVPEPDERHLEWWHSGIVGDVILLHSYDPNDSNDHLEGATVLDAATGERLWSLQGFAGIVADLITIMDGDTFRAVHPRTGEVLWERPGEQPDWSRGDQGQPWIVTTTGTNLLLLDPDTGQELASLDGSFVAPLVPVGDVWIGVLHDEPEITPAGRTVLGLIAIDPDGDTVWRTPIGGVDWPQHGCCLIRDDPAAGTFLVTDPDGVELEFDTASGELVSVEEPPPGNEERDHPIPFDVWWPSPGTEMRWQDDGQRLEIRTAGGAVTVTSGHGIQPEFFDPIIVSDGRHVIGVQVVPE